MPQLLLPLPPPAGSISMPGLEGTSSRRFGKGEGRFLEDLRSHLCHQSCSASFGAPETNRGVAHKPPPRESQVGLLPTDHPGQGTRASARLQRLILTHVTAHNDRFSQVPAGTGQEWLSLCVWNVKTGSLSWRSWGLKMDGELLILPQFSFLYEKTSANLPAKDGTRIIKRKMSMVIAPLCIFLHSEIL